MFVDIPKDFRWKISTGLPFFDTLLGYLPLDSEAACTEA